MNKKRIMIAILGLVSLTVAGDEYIDTKTKVVYTYNKGENSAEVKAGRTYWKGGNEQQSEYEEIDEPGSPDVAGGITILDKFEIDGQDFTVRQIGDRAFFCCERITAVTFPETLTSIGELSFYQCTGLNRIEIPKTVMSIGSDAFGQCTQLTSIVSLIDNPFDTDAFKHLSTSYITLYVPKGCSMKYKAARGWSKFENIVEIETSGINFHEIFGNTNTKDDLHDLQGQRIMTTGRKGIYIQRGKKFIVKQ